MAARPGLRILRLENYKGISPLMLCRIALCVSNACAEFKGNLYLAYELYAGQMIFAV